MKSTNNKLKEDFGLITEDTLQALEEAVRIVEFFNDVPHKQQPKFPVKVWSKERIKELEQKMKKEGKL